MVKALSVTAHAFRLWWQEMYLLIFYNLVLLSCQVLIVPGPAATAAMYVIARQLADGEVIEPRHGLKALRRMFAQAWVWVGINLLIAGVLTGNFWLYQSATGWLWMVLRLVWGVIALGWFAVNLFYWPFWLAQDQHSPQLTFRNGYFIFGQATRPGSHSCANQCFSLRHQCAYYLTPRGCIDGLAGVDRRAGRRGSIASPR